MITKRHTDQQLDNWIQRTLKRIILSKTEFRKVGPKTMLSLPHMDEKYEKVKNIIIFN